MHVRPHFSSLSLTLSLAALSLALAACGGGAGSANTTANPVNLTANGNTPTGKEVATGTVTGFGSTIVEGQKYEDNSASVQIEDDPANPRAGTTSDVKLGAQVETKSDGSTAVSIAVRSEVVGRVTSLTTDGFLIAGITVKVSSDASAPTVYEGLTALADIKLNDFLEVHGQRDASDNLIASRIERRDPASAVFTKVVGTITALDITAKTFTLGGLTVAYGTALKILPSAASLATGKRVVVFTDSAINANTLNAKTVVVRGDAATSLGDAARVAGRIRQLDFAAKTFVVDGVSVDASKATFVKGTTADLANGRKLRVIGSFSESKLVASEVRFVKDQGDAQVDLKGGISDFVSASSFKLRGVPVNAGAATVVFANGTASNLGNFVVVRIKGAVEADVVKATEVEFISSSEDVNRAFVGSVKNYNATSGAFTLENIGMKLIATTIFKNQDGSTAAKVDFGNDDAVAVKGSFKAGTFEVSQVTFRTGPSLVINYVEGAASNVQISNGRFRLNGQVIVVNSSTQYEGSLVNLRDGAQVEVSGSLVNGELVARTVEIKGPKAAEASEVRGTVASFVSVSQFKVGNATVDASGASFTGGKASDLSNGDFIEVRGPVVNGVLKATSLKFKN